MRLALLVAAWLALSPALAQDRVPDGGGSIPAPTDDITEAERAQIKATIEANRGLLKAKGLLPASDPIAAATPAAGSLGWPLRMAPSTRGYGYHGISNFVDLSSPMNSLLDWNCGSRTYDLSSSSYNHRGIDIFLWPFKWKMMDEQSVRVVAAAAGTIIAKSDGNYDRNCAMGSATANAVYVQHGDGSVAWYLHLKSGSLTRKAVGSAVVQGEYLGTVGSSGSSTGPHLHFEIHDAQGNIKEPFAGSCNAGSSLWAVQPAYYDSTVNRIATHAAPPVFPTCPDQETTNESDSFSPGDTVYFATYYRDQLSTLATTYTVYKPDGTVYSTWTHTPPASHYASSYWYWSLRLSSSVPSGIWRFKASFNGADYEHRFTVGTSTAMVTPQSGWWWNASEPGRGFSLELRGNNLFLSTYLYNTDGTPIWYIAQGGLSGNTFSGSLQQFAGGQTLSGSYQAASFVGSPGSVSLTFTSPTTATLVWPGGTVELVRYDIVSGGVAAGATADAPETGWWWSSAEPGRGYFAELQGSTLFLSGYMYDGRGQATWFVSTGVMTETLLYQGTLLGYSGGQTLTGAYQAATYSGSLGSVTIQFSSATDGVLTLPNGSRVALTRYRY